MHLLPGGLAGPEGRSCFPATSEFDYSGACSCDAPSQLLVMQLSSYRLRGQRSSPSLRLHSGIHEDALPQFDVHKSPQKRTVIGETVLVLLNQILNEGWIEESSPLQHRRREKVPYKRSRLIAKP